MRDLISKEITNTSIEVESSARNKFKGGKKTANWNSATR